MDSRNGSGCPHWLPVGDQPQRGFQRKDSYTDCSLHIVSEMEQTAKCVFPRRGNDSASHIGPARCVVLSPVAGCCSPKAQLKKTRLTLPVSYTVSQIIVPHTWNYINTESLLSRLKVSV